MWFFRNNAAPAPTPAPEPATSSGFFSSDFFSFGVSRPKIIANAVAKTFRVKLPRPSAAMDSSDDDNFNKLTTIDSDVGVSDTQISWYGAQGFIGFSMCAILAQQWLIAKACLTPARDAVRKGWKVTGANVSPEMAKQLARLDKAYGIKENLVEFEQFGRVFGIRVALFVNNSDDPKYYENPFNPDGITKDSYVGISQIDPNWMSPVLDEQAVTNPAAISFYEPTYWQISGKKYHKSHLVICRPGGEVSDVLKPTYLYAGVSIPQKIYERVYAAERTANEAPQLALTKRSTILHVDMEKAVADEESFLDRLRTWCNFRDNFGIKALGQDEVAEQFDTTLTGLDETIMTQYGLVCAAANVPITKMLGTVPKGFNATGEYDEASYHEELESIQETDLTPMLDRHYVCLNYSALDKALGVVDVEWEPLDALTELEQANVNLVKSQAGFKLASSGAIDGSDERARLVADPSSGYDNLLPATPEVTT